MIMSLFNKYNFNWSLQLCFLLVSSTFILIILGSLIRLTHSGLSCPDWPLCYGLFLLTPSKIAIIEHEISYQYNQIIFEWVHRIFAACIIAVLMILLLIDSLLNSIKLKFQYNFNILLSLFYLFVILIIQVLLGSLTVLEQNINWSVTLHLLNALIFYNSTIMLYVLMRQSVIPTKIEDKYSNYIGMLVLILFYLNNSLGAMVSVSGVDLYTQYTQSLLTLILSDPFILIHFLHFSISLIIGFIIILYIMKFYILRNINFIIFLIIGLLFILNVLLGLYLFIHNSNSLILKSIYQILSLIIFTIYSYSFWKNLLISV